MKGEQITTLAQLVEADRRGDLIVYEDGIHPSTASLVLHGSGWTIWEQMQDGGMYLYQKPEAK